MTNPVKQTPKKRLQVLMLTDFAALDQEEEYRDIRGEMTELFPECDLSFQQEFYMNKFSTIPDDAWDIFVLDWGGLLPGCEGLTTSIYKEVVRLSRKFPNKLFIMWSTFTQRYYLDAAGVQDSYKMLNGELSELIHQNIALWFDDRLKARCREFFGLPERIAEQDEKPYYKYGIPAKLVAPTMFVKDEVEDKDNDAK